MNIADDDCEDQALAYTSTCTKCVLGFEGKRAINAPLLCDPADGFYKCTCCGASYGKQPHPNLMQDDSVKAMHSPGSKQYSGNDQSVVAIKANTDCTGETK